MLKGYSRDQLWKLYNALPVELKEAIFSTEVSEDIFNICIRNDIENKQITEIIRCTGKVLLGVLSPDEFQNDLEKEVGLKEEVAKKVAQEINRFVFYPLKPALEKLYKTEITPPTRPITEPKKTFKETAAASPEKEEKPQAPSKKDVYREPIE